MRGREQPKKNGEPGNFRRAPRNTLLLLVFVWENRFRRELETVKTLWLDLMTLHE